MTAADNLGGFAHVVTDRGGKPGDERSKRLWELWAKVADAEKMHRQARERYEEAARDLNSASCAVTNTGTKLRELHEQLTELVAVPPEPEREHPVEE